MKPRRLAVSRPATRPRPRSRRRRLRALICGTLATALTSALTSAVVGVPLATPASAATTAEVSPVAAQTVDSIGASGAWWVNDLVTFAPSVQARVADLLFGSGGLSLSAYRYNIGGGGAGVSNPVRAPQTFQTSPGSYDWTRDPGGRMFLQDAASAGVPELIGFVNSAPSAFTSNGKSCGGSLAAGTESAYATYLADVVAHFAAQGVTLNDLSPMNEPDDSFSACGQEGMAVPVSQRDDVVRALGATLAARGLSTGISADETSSSATFVTNAPTWLGVSGTAQYVSSLAHHTYDHPSDATRVALMNLGRTSGKHTWASEICCFAGVGGGWAQQYDPTITGGLALADLIYRDFTVTGDTSFQWWTALSPKLGCDPVAAASCPTQVNTGGWNDGLVYYDPNYATDGNQTLYLTKRYGALGQYSRFVRPGAVRHAVLDAPSGVQAAAFDRNGQWTVVVTNQNASSTSLALHFASGGSITPVSAHRTSATEDLASVSAPSVSGSTMTATLPANSISTYVLAQGGGAATSVTGALVGSASGRCLEGPGAVTMVNVQATIHDCTGGTNQTWSYTPAAEVQVAGTGCLGSLPTTSPVQAVIQACSGTTAQTWWWNSNGTLINQASGQCLDVNGGATANGSGVILWTCNGGSNQSWHRP